MKLVKWLVYGVIALCVLAICSFCGLFLWVGGIENQVFRQSLPIFPEAREVSNAYGIYGGGAGLQTLYFWTAKSLQDVKAYYESFTPAFVYSKYPFDWAAHDYYRTAFNPSGKLPVMTAEFGGETNNPLQNKSCYYQMRYTCVEIELVDFGTSQSVSLRPPPGPMRMGKKPSPLESELRGGTLIVYMYFVGDGS
jgi:hypothetical protein